MLSATFNRYFALCFSFLFWLVCFSDYEVNAVEVKRAELLLAAVVNVPRVDHHIPDTLLAYGYAVDLVNLKNTDARVGLL